MASAILQEVLGLGHVALTATGTAAAIPGVSGGAADGLSGCRASGVISCTVNGQAVFALVRVGQAVNGPTVDVVFAESLAALEIAATALDLSGEGVSHSYPARDARDDQALTGAA